MSAANREAGEAALEAAVSHAANGDTGRARHLLSKARKLAPNLERIVAVEHAVEAAELVESIVADGTRIDHYAVLGVEPSASDVELKKGYHKRCLKIHPDKCAHPKATAAFQCVKEAFAELSDSAKRSVHDLARKVKAQAEARAVGRSASSRVSGAGKRPSTGRMTDEEVRRMQEELFRDAQQRQAAARAAASAASAASAAADPKQKAAAPENNEVFEEVRALATDRSGSVVKKISKDLAASDPKTTWHMRCGETHEFAATTEVLRAGGWCPVCEDEKEVRALATDRSGSVVKKISKDLAASDPKTTWHMRCDEKHEFAATNEVLRAGGWCPVCQEAAAASTSNNAARSTPGEADEPKQAQSKKRQTPASQNTSKGQPKKRARRTANTIFKKPRGRPPLDEDGNPKRWNEEIGGWEGN